MCSCRPRSPGCPTGQQIEERYALRREQYYEVYEQEISFLRSGEQGGQEVARIIEAYQEVEKAQRAYLRHLLMEQFGVEPPEILPPLRGRST